MGVMALPCRSLVALLCCGIASAQVIEFEQNGLRYQALTRSGLTVMFAELPQAVREYAIVQFAVINGSRLPWSVRVEDLEFERPDGSLVRPMPPRSVVTELVEKAGRNDVIKLVSTYEATLYGMTRYKATNGYEQRRRSALAEVQSAKLKAAAAASAIAFVSSKLAPGESTDGAVFWANGGRPLGPGRLRFRAAGELFEFEPYLTPNP